MTDTDLTIREIEKLGYYDFMSYLGVPFFHIGGLKSSEELAELCHINRNRKLLVVGCGTGFSACHIAKKFGCTVIGVDIAQVSVDKANERAQKEHIEDKVDFRIGDAYDLPFESDTFDAVITEFVSQFLDKARAFQEFARVLKPGGYVGVNELYSDKDITPETAKQIMAAEQIFADITKLPFKMHTPQDWRQWFEGAGLHDVQIDKHKATPSPKEAIWLMKGIGFKLLMRMMIMLLKYTLSSKIIRTRMKKLEKGKKILFSTKPASKHVGYILGTGKKA
ncbi:MAG: class I SAM-dependent methyltransferase [Methanosarcinales archaeon]|nr:class I SAM-dependent methyltransferase [Methanosarcinales archaeon]